MNIYVGNLPFEIDDTERERTFTAFGEVSSARVIQDRESGRSRGFGFVEMADNSQAEVITIIVDGDLRYAGTYPVSSMSYSLTPTQGTPVIYSSENDPDVTVTVLGFSDGHTNLFANIEGETDLDGIAFTGGEARGWPPW